MSDTKVIASVSYSEAEKHLLKILQRRSTPIGVDALSKIYYDGKDDRNAPFHAVKSLRSMLDTLSKKIEHNRESFELLRSDGRPAKYSIVERKIGN
jgi:hypothetical protein